MDRFEIIRNKAQRDYEVQIQKKELENAKHKTLLNKVKELKPRIKYLIDLANECVNNQINIGQNYIGSYRDYYSNKDYFLTDGWAHHTGFWYDYNLKTITAIGKEGGGACLIKFYVLHFLILSFEFAPHNLFVPCF